MESQRPWHQLFGLSLIDFFRGQPVTVELEKDLSLKQQRLDVVVLRKGPSPLACRMPDGFDDLAAHNLITFKSYQDTLDGWALNELIGHYVNYRKQSSPTMRDLLSEADFRLFAVCVRFPQALARQVPFTPLRPGVYELRHFTGPFRVTAIHELPDEEHNALFHLFVAKQDPGTLRNAALSDTIERDEHTLLRQLFERYRSEDLEMPDALEQFVQETWEELLNNTSAEELLKRVSPQKLLKGLSPDEVLAALSPETLAAITQRLKEKNPPSEGKKGVAVRIPYVHPFRYFINPLNRIFQIDRIWPTRRSKLAGVAGNSQRMVNGRCEILRLLRIGVGIGARGVR